MKSLIGYEVMTFDVSKIVHLAYLTCHTLPGLANSYKGRRFEFLHFLHPLYTMCSIKLSDIFQYYKDINYHSSYVLKLFCLINVNTFSKLTYFLDS